MNPEDQVRALLEEAVADVEPKHGLAAIRSRTVGPRRRAWGWGVGGAVLATAATIAVVAALGAGGPVGPPAGPDPADRSTSPAVGGPRTVYFVGTTGVGPRLFPELLRPASSAAALDEAVTEAVAGTTSDEDYRSPWPSGTTMERAQVSEGVLSIDLSGPVARRPSGMTRAEAALAVQQLVYTAQAVAHERLPVTFLLEGRPAATLLGEPTDRPVAAAAADDVLSSVSVISPANGETVTSPFTVRGNAAAFEANVQWELRRGSAVIRRGFATAAECCTLSPYSFTVEAPPGDYSLVVHDEDVSDGEGNPPTQDTKRLTIR